MGLKKTDKKYGIFTAVSMVIGSVIGSGVFFKAETISRITSGNSAVGIYAWLIGGAVMLLCLLNFASMTETYGGEGGIAGIAEKAAGERFGYFTGWFMATVYYPALVSVLAYLSAKYTLLFFGVTELGGGMCLVLSFLFLIASFVQNTLFPAFSGKFQVATTVLKLVPLFLMITFGIIKGCATGILAENMNPHSDAGRMLSSLFPAVTASMFAYEGWVAVSSIGSEIKNSRRNLPLALISGGTGIIAIYVLYYAGISGAVKSEVLINYGTEGVRMAFEAILGRGVGRLLTVFVAVSCIGALNAMTMGCGRGMYELAYRGKGPLPKLFSKIMPGCMMPVPSFAFGLMVSEVWLFFLFGSQVTQHPFLHSFSFDVSEMPIATIYLLYIPAFLSFGKKCFKEKKNLQLLLAVAGIASCIFILLCAVISHKTEMVNYIVALTAIMLTGEVFYPKDK